MKSRTVITLWILALVLGVIACIIQFGGSNDTSARTKLAPGDKILNSLPIREITKVTVNQGEESTTLIRLSSDTWGVSERDNYPVNYEKLRNLLGALSEVEVTQGYPAGKEHFARFGLIEKSEEPSEHALRVTMHKADGITVADVFLGKFSGTSQVGGRFLRTASDNSGVYAVGETFPGISAAPQTWLGKDLLKLEKIKSIALSATNDPDFKPWKLVRHPNTDGTVNENGQLTLDGMTDQEVMQLTSTNPMRNLLSYATFKDILTEEQAKESANPDTKLKRQAVITTFDGLTYTLTFWPQKDKPKDSNADPRLPAVQADYLLTVTVNGENQEKLTAAQSYEGRIYQVSQSTVSPLLKKRSDFVKVKNKPAATTPPARVPGLAPSAPRPIQP